MSNREGQRQRQRGTEAKTKTDKDRDRAGTDLTENKPNRANPAPPPQV